MKLKPLFIVLLIYFLLRESLSFYKTSYYLGKDALVVLNGASGNALFITTVLDKHILINGGPDFDIDASLSSIVPFWNLGCRLDLVVLTRSKAGYMIGLDRLIQRCRVGLILFNEPSSRFPEWESWKKNVEGFNVSRISQAEKFIVDELKFSIAESSGAVVLQLERGDFKVQLTSNADIIKFFGRIKIQTVLIGDTKSILAFF